MGPRNGKWAKIKAVYQNRLSCKQKIVSVCIIINIVKIKTKIKLETKNKMFCIPIILTICNLAIDIHTVLISVRASYTWPYVVQNNQSSKTIIINLRIWLNAERRRRGVQVEILESRVSEIPCLWISECRAIPVTGLACLPYKQPFKCCFYERRASPVSGIARYKRDLTWQLSTSWLFLFVYMDKRASPVGWI